MPLHRYEPFDGSSSITVSLPSRVHDALNVDSSVSVQRPGADRGSVSTTVAPGATDATTPGAVTVGADVAGVAVAELGAADVDAPAASVVGTPGPVVGAG